jgi:hypothetical protein
LLFHLSILPEVWLLNFLRPIYTYIYRLYYMLYLYNAVESDSDLLASNHQHMFIAKRPSAAC